MWRADDGGATWRFLNTHNPRPMYFSQIRVDPQTDSRIYVLGVQLHVSDDGGRTFRNDGAERIHVDHHAMWINPSDASHIFVGNDGGVAESEDRGNSWRFVATLPPAQYYHVAVDNVAAAREITTQLIDAGRRRIAAVGAEREREDVVRELEDRFGPPPRSVLNLVEYAGLKSLCEKMLVSTVERKNDRLARRFHSETPVRPERLVRVVRSRRGAILDPSGVLWIEWKPEAGSPAAAAQGVLLELQAGG